MSNFCSGWWAAAKGTTAMVGVPTDHWYQTNAKVLNISKPPESQ